MNGVQQYTAGFVYHNELPTKDEQMENRKVRLGTFVMLLTFGLVLAACSGGPDIFSQLFGTSSGPGTSEFRTRRNNDGNLVIVKYSGQGEEVLIPAEFEGIPVVEIGQAAFSGNKTIKSVIIPDGITVIEKDAFDGCTSLTSISIPASVIRIGAKGNDSEDSFDRCTSLTDITVAEANGVYSSEDDVLFNKGKTTLLLCPEGKGGNYTIPASVTDIVYCAFESCVRLRGVTIPDSVTSIGEWAFVGCTGLTSIIIPGSVKTITGDMRGDNAYGAFYGCTGLTSVTISEGVTSIGATAFFGCTGLTSVVIPGSVTSIGEQAFAVCAGLRSVTISDGVTSIGHQAFRLSGLTSITIPDSVTYIGANAFAQCSELTSVTVSPVNGRRWDDRGGNAGAFLECPKLSPAAKDALRRAGYTLF
jgi:hypothetical protein